MRSCINGVRKSFTADTKKEAERLANAYVYSQEGHSGLTVSEAVEAYIAGRESILSPNTVKDYRITQKYHMKTIQRYKLENLDNKILQIWVNELSQKLSPKSVKNCYTLIASVLASEMPQKRIKVSMPKIIHADMQMPSESDIRAVRAAVRGTDLEVPVELAVCCCMRRGEIAALLAHKEHIHRDSVTVRYNMIKSGNDWICKDPKTPTSYRTIPCPKELIFKARNTDPILPSTITDHWIKLMKRMNLPYRFHDLRHFSASAMLTVMPRVDVERFGGWQHNSPVLSNIYTYNIDESLNRSAKVWSEKLANL